MSRLTNGQRADLRRQLLAALIPDRAAELRKLEHAAFDALIRDFYGTAGLKRIATLPDEWLTTVQGVRTVRLARSEGPALGGYVCGPERRLPRELPNPYEPKSDTAGQAALAYFEAKYADEQERGRIGYQVDTVLNGSTTLESVLEKLPAARGILNLPDAAPAAEVAATLNAQLAARQPKPRVKKEG
jgi:hypothetical protein